MIAISVFLIEFASSIFFPLTHSVIKELEAIADPQPNVLNLASSLPSSLTLIFLLHHRMQVLLPVRCLHYRSFIERTDILGIPARSNFLLYAILSPFIELCQCAAHFILLISLLLGPSPRCGLNDLTFYLGNNCLYGILDILF